MIALERATLLVNTWIREAPALKPESRSILLIQMIVRLIRRVEQESYELGQDEAGKIS